MKLLIGLVITLGMWWLAKWVEEKHFYFGTQARELVYDVIQHGLGTVARQNLNVIVVDVSDVGWTPRKDPNQPREYDYTDRKQLRDVVMKIADQSPAAIGLDIDFTPYPIQLEDDDEFLACLLARSTGYRESADSLANGPLSPACFSTPNHYVPIYVATYTSLALGPVYALERPEYSALAAFAGAVIPSQYEAPRRMVDTIEIRYGLPGSGSWVVNSLSVAMHPKVQQNSLANIPGVAESISLAPHNEVPATEFYVDYGSIDRIEATTVASASLMDPKQPQIVNSLKGQYILVGRGKGTTDMDQHNIPGRLDRRYSGVYLHACAIYTLDSGPLLALLLPRGRLVLDLSLFLLIFGVVELTIFARKRFLQAQTRAGVLHLVVTVLVVVAAIVGGIYLAGSFRIMWDDSLFVAVGLIGHAVIDHVFTHD
ncbi:MAG TPA: CHASE2 domain-containing protein [Candidatus Acidoferrales bacterium]